MYYLRARYYDPYVKRFTSYDIIEGDISNPLDMNRYAYCRNNPVRYIDPTGESIAVGSALLYALNVAMDTALTWAPYVIAGTTAVAKTIYFAKGGKQNKKSSEFSDVSDAELDKMYKDPKTSKKQKQKIKTEQKARKTRHSSQKK